MLLSTEYYSGTKYPTTQKINHTNFSLFGTKKEDFVPMSKGELLTGTSKIDIGCETFVIPQRLKILQKTIEKSTYIFDLQNDWDDEGSLGYEKTTWIKAVHFVINYAEWILDNFDEVMYIPEIYHGKESGIDILWENSEYRMLIRLDKQIEKGFFYSDNLHKQTSEGEFQVSKINYLMLPTPISF